MGRTLAWGRARLWYDKQPLWLAERLLEPLGLVILGSITVTILCGACWLVVLVARYALTLNNLRDLAAGL